MGVLYSEINTKQLRNEIKSASIRATSYGETTIQQNNNNSNNSKDNSDNSNNVGDTAKQHLKANL